MSSESQAIMSLTILLTKNPETGQREYRINNPALEIEDDLNYTETKEHVECTAGNLNSVTLEE